MTEQRDGNGERLRHAFEAHENLAPEALPVHARIEELARGYRRRRRGLQAVGGVVAGAGLVAGVVAAPGLLPGGSKSDGKVRPAAAAPALAAPAPTPSPTPTESSHQKDLDAFFAAGYDYQDAEKLAELWHVRGTDLDRVKAEAGAKLLAGEKLPVKPSEPPYLVQSPKEVAEVNAFFNAGYSYQDAVKLAQLWKLKDPYHAKVKGGKEIIAGESLPIAP